MGSVKKKQGPVEAVGALLRARKVFADHVAPDMSLHAAHVFLEVARAHYEAAAGSGGLGAPKPSRLDHTELQELCGVSTSAISRIVDTFSERGLGYLASKSDLEDRRRKFVTLTPKGVKLVERLNEAVS